MYPGKDIVVFFTAVSEQLANDHIFCFNLRCGDL